MLRNGPSANTLPNPDAIKMMIEHTVTFSLKHSPDSDAERAFLAAANELSAIPGVQDFAIRRQVSAKHPHSKSEPILSAMKRAANAPGFNYAKYVMQSYIKELITPGFAHGARPGKKGNR